MALSVTGPREKEVTQDLIPQAPSVAGPSKRYDIGAWANASVHVLVDGPDGTFKCNVEVSNVDVDTYDVIEKANIALTDLVQLVRNTKYVRLNVTAGTATKLGMIFHGTLQS